MLGKVGVGNLTLQRHNIIMQNNNMTVDVTLMISFTNFELYNDLFYCTHAYDDYLYRKWVVLSNGIPVLV